jgi:serine/threonine protein kinase
LARQLLTNQKVALKVIPKLSIKQKDVRAKIEKEVRILKRVNNDDNIIKLYEVFEDRNYVYLVFELLERGDLVNFFRENTLLEEDELRKFFREIGNHSSALICSHGSQVSSQEQCHSSGHQIGQYSS